LSAISDGSTVGKYDLFAEQISLSAGIDYLSDALLQRAVSQNNNKAELIISLFKGRFQKG
jgi:hypothetical protein